MRSSAERIRKLFESGAGGRETLRQLCELADGTIKKVYGELLRVRNAFPAQAWPCWLGGYGARCSSLIRIWDLLSSSATKKRG